MMGEFRWDDKVVLLTGGTGSFGQKFTARVLRECAPSKLIIYSRDEMKQFEMAQQYNEADVRLCDGRLCAKPAPGNKRFGDKGEYILVAPRE